MNIPSFVCIITWLFSLAIGYLLIVDFAQPWMLWNLLSCGSLPWINSQKLGNKILECLWIGSWDVATWVMEVPCIVLTLVGGLIFLLLLSNLDSSSIAGSHWFPPITPMSETSEYKVLSHCTYYKIWSTIAIPFRAAFTFGIWLEECRMLGKQTRDMTSEVDILSCDVTTNIQSLPYYEFRTNIWTSFC